MTAMTPDQVRIVQSTFARVAPMAGKVAELFYARLFEIDPPLRALFKGDMVRQGNLLMGMIGAGVRGLSDTPSLVPVLRQLGARHGGYGVQAHHYTTVGLALLWTLEHGLGEEFTPEVRDAWAAAYTLIATTMQQGAIAEPLAA